MLHGRILTSALALLAACGAQNADHALLSASRLALRELGTGTVGVDVASSADFDVGVAANASALTPVLTIAKAGTGFSVTPSCDASHGPDKTYEVVVTAGARTETLEVVVTNEPGAACFRYADVEEGLQPSQIACADIVGDGGFEVVFANGAAAGMSAQLPQGLGSAGSSTAIPTLVPIAIQQVFAIDTALGPEIYGVDRSANIYQLGSSGWETTGKNVGSNVIAMRSPGSATPDFFAGFGACTKTTSSYCIHFVQVVGASTSEAPFLSPGGMPEYLGSWAQGSGLSAITFPVQQLQPARVYVYQPDWSTTPPTTPPTTLSFIGSTVPAIPSGSMRPTTVVFASRSGPAEEDIVLALGNGPYDTVVSEVEVAPQVVPKRVYAGVRSVASTPEGGVLLGADQGAELSRFIGTNPPAYKLIDLAVQQFDSIYGAAIAPCLDKTGALAGYAVVADMGHARVALLPDVP